MKKITYLLISIFVFVNLAACSSKPNNVEKVNANNEAHQNNIETSKSVSMDYNKDNTKDTSTVDNKDALIQNTTVSTNKVNSNNKSGTTQSSNSTISTSVNTSNSSKQSQQTSQVKNKKIIVIDPGHANKSNLDKEPLAPGSSEMKIKDGGGAKGVATGTPEYKVNMNVAVKLKNILESKGYTVVMTKTQDSQSLGNVERANIWNNANASLVLRIHADSSDNNSAKGASMLVPSPINDNTKAIYTASKSYGKTVLNTLVQEVGMVNRGVIEHKDMTGFNWSRVPVILVEMGFLSNPDEDRLLSSQAYEDKLAKALGDGIISALK